MMGRRKKSRDRTGAARRRAVYDAIRDWVEKQNDRGIRCLGKGDGPLCVNVWGDFGSVIGAFLFWEENEVALFLDLGIAVPEERKEDLEAYLRQVNEECPEGAARFYSEDGTSIDAVNVIAFEGELPDPAGLDRLLHSTRELLDRRSRDVIRFLYGRRAAGPDKEQADVPRS